jgi:hypothetical protein
MCLGVQARHKVGQHHHLYASSAGLEVVSSLELTRELVYQVLNYKMAVFIISPFIIATSFNKSSIIH